MYIARVTLQIQVFVTAGDYMTVMTYFSSENGLQL